MALDKINISVVEREAPRSGPTSSANYNATLQEIINSFAQIYNGWNNELQPLIDSLPTGRTVIAREDRSGTPDPFTNGMDGSQVYLDLTSTELIEDGKYYNEDQSRPYTIKESLENLETKLTDNIQDILVELSRVSQSTGITTRQKQAIGARIFNPDQTSSSNSLDGLVQLLIRYSNQLEYDIAGNDSFLDGAGVQTLDFSILSMISAIKNAHIYDPVFNTFSHDNLDIHTHRYHIIPAGALNGINRTFTLLGGEVFKDGTLQIFLNGVQPMRFTHYSEAPDRKSFEFTAAYGAPDPTDKLWIHYILED